MKVQAIINGQLHEGEASLVANKVMCGGTLHSGIDVSGFSEFINETIAYAINEGSVLFDTIEAEAESDDVPWKVTQAMSQELDELRLRGAKPAPGSIIITEDGYRFTVNEDGSSFGDGDQTFDSMSQLDVEFVIGEKFVAPFCIDDTLIKLGFTLTSTGGGCEAWEFEHGGYYLMLTDSDGSRARDLTETYLLWLGYYKSNQDHSDHTELLEGFWGTEILRAIEEFKEGKWQARQPDAGGRVEVKVAQAGELLIRAAAVLGTLTKEQLEQLRLDTDGALPDSLGFALKGAASISDSIRNSLKTHPPKGFESL